MKLYSLLGLQVFSLFLHKPGYFIFFKSFPEATPFSVCVLLKCCKESCSVLHGDEAALSGQIYFCLSCLPYLVHFIK